MYAWFYKGSDLLHLPLLSLVLFISVFVAVAIRAWRAKDLNGNSAIASLPLDDGEVTTGGSHV